MKEHLAKQEVSFQESLCEIDLLISKSSVDTFFFVCLGFNRLTVRIKEKQGIFPTPSQISTICSFKVKKSNSGSKGYFFFSN